MREIRNGIIRWPVDEPLPPPFNAVSESRFVVHGNFRYFTSSMLTGPPWLAFPDAVELPGQNLPPGFVAVFGLRPANDGSAEARTAGDFWDQQLSFWKDASKPEWLDPVTEAAAKLVFEHYGMGSRLLFYRLTNGAERVAFPDADSRILKEQLPLMYWEDCYVAFRLTQQAIGVYQLARMALGVRIPDSEKVPFILRLGEQSQHHG